MNKRDYFNKKKWLIDELSSDLVQIHGIKRVLHDTYHQFSAGTDCRDRYFRDVPGAGWENTVRREGRVYLS